MADPHPTDALVEKRRRRRSRTLDQRFFAKVHMTDGCWLWAGSRNKGPSRDRDGYRQHGSAEHVGS